MNHSGQETMSQPPKNQEMLKLYTFNLSLTNPEEQCPSTTQTIMPTSPLLLLMDTRPEQRLWPLQIIYTCNPKLSAPAPKNHLILPLSWCSH